MTEHLWQTYSNRVCRYFQKRLDQKYMACDLMQDTFQKVFTNEEKLEGIGNYESWIFRIARNTLIDYTRKKKEDSLDDLSISADTRFKDAQKSEIEEISKCLMELIEEYSREEQDVLLKVFKKSLSQKEAAKHLNIPYSTFKSRVQKARKEIVIQFNRRCCQLKYDSNNQIIGCDPLSQ
ncbi:RNA polymerase sigma factor [Fodinibius sp. SL11]|uniref:RNA polymerase sigma factor n=1 Tax=Fodinibius sp. SL11 TaxID=3425690 RepID=UPI003F883D50